MSRGATDGKSGGHLVQK